MLNLISCVLSSLNIILITLFYFFGDKVGKVERIDLATIVLTSVAILVTVLGVGMAVLALWGYKSIENKAIEKAVKAAQKEANEKADSILEEINRTERLNSSFKLDRDSNSSLNSDSLEDLENIITDDSVLKK